MRTQKNWIVNTAEINCQLQVWYNKKLYTAELGCGRYDDKYLFRDGTALFFIAINHGLEYVGLQCFEISMDQLELEEVGSVFLQYDWQVNEVLGPRGINLTPITIAKRLAERV